MAEAMTVETIVEAYWLLQNYWTKVRFPVQTKKGGWSDIDVLAYNPLNKTLVISESKVRGEKDAVYAFTTDAESVIAFDIKKKNYFKSLGDITKYACNNYVNDKKDNNDGEEKLFKIRDMINDGIVNTVIVQLVSNYYISEDLKPSLIKELRDNYIRENIPPNIKKKNIVVKIDTTFDILIEVIKLEYGKNQGRRYGHPVIDIARELNRYMRGTVHNVGNGTEIKKIFTDKLREAFPDKAL
jgi:hypothetical protein